MIAIVQRVKSGRVTVAGQVVGEIGVGMVVLAAVHADDTSADVGWMAAKIATLRIFPSEDGEKYFDRDVKAVGGGVLLISNFTVAAETQSGRRPSLSPAASPEAARPIFEELLRVTRAQGVTVATGEFGADMLVDIANDGPVTFLLDSRPSRKK